jgi:hypothetical protein
MGRKDVPCVPSEGWRRFFQFSFGPMGHLRQMARIFFADVGSCTWTLCNRVYEPSKCKAFPFAAIRLRYTLPSIEQCGAKVVQMFSESSSFESATVLRLRGEVARPE